ncbi:MAG: hypothetical protein E6471_30270, partial [Bradyrhizobium sp.]|nr:hypothetical protein [Bradyrhizobium sp.]
LLNNGHGNPSSENAGMAGRPEPAAAVPQYTVSSALSGGPPGNFNLLMPEPANCSVSIAGAPWT